MVSSNLVVRFHEPLVEWLRHRTFTAVARVRIPYGLFTIHGSGYFILIAQLAEHSIDNGEVGGSSPSQNIGNE